MSAEAVGAVGARIAFFGPLTLLAEEIRRALEGRAFPVAEVRLYDEASEGTLSEFSGEALIVTRPDEDVISGLDIAFMCGTPDQTVPYLDWPARHGFVAIDVSGVSGTDPRVPIVHAGVNPAAIVSDRGPHPVIAVPRAVSHNLATVAAASAAAGRVDRIDAVALRPAADFGKEAVDELYRQTVALLNFSPVPQERLGRQLAFNLLPSSRLAAAMPAHPPAASSYDDACALETSRLLGLEPEKVGLASAMMPMFHGHAMHVTLTFAGPVDPVVLREAFGATRGIRWVADPGDFDPVALAGEEDVAVMFPDDRTVPRAHASFWCFCDNLKGGAAVNAVRVAERSLDLRRETAR